MSDITLGLIVAAIEVPVVFWLLDHNTERIIAWLDRLTERIQGGTEMSDIDWSMNFPEPLHIPNPSPQPDAGKAYGIPTPPESVEIYASSDNANTKPTPDATHTDAGCPCSQGHSDAIFTQQPFSARSEYGHEDAMRDLDVVLHAATIRGAKSHYDRLAAYIERLEAENERNIAGYEQYEKDYAALVAENKRLKAQSCVVFDDVLRTNEKLVAENERLRKQVVFHSSEVLKLLARAEAAERVVAAVVVHLSFRDFDGYPQNVEIGEALAAWEATRHE